MISLDRNARTAVEHISTIRTKSNSRTLLNETTLHGYRLFLARSLWVLLVLATVVVFCLGIPQTFKMALFLHPESVAGLEHIGLSAHFYATYIVVIDTMMFASCVLFAVLIFSRRPSDWMVMFVGLTLLLTALLYTAPAFEAPVPLPVIGLLAALAEICQVAFVYLFPDGRFVPRRIWLALLPLFVWRPAMWIVVYLPHFFSLRRSGENFYYIPQDNRDLVLFLGLLAIGIIAQVYRYRHHSTAIQRQQTKWLVLGIAFAIMVVGSYVLVVNALPAVQQLNTQALLARLLSRTLNHLVLLLLPVMLTFSILRYRLWEIDRLINRTLVYSTLTVSLAIIYGVSILILQVALGEVINGNQFAVVGSTLLSAVMFQPLRRRIQWAIDRRFYRSKHDAAIALTAFSETLRHEVDIEQLTERLLEVVQSTMQPEHVSLWVKQPERKRREAETLHPPG